MFTILITDEDAQNHQDRINETIRENREPWDIHHSIAQRGCYVSYSTLLFFKEAEQTKKR